MRQALLATLTAIAVATFAGCSDQQPTSPTEPIFGKKPPSECLTQAQQDLSAEIRLDIDRLFTGKNTKKTAHGKINNIERKLCKDQYDDATKMAWGFLEFTNEKMPDKFVGDEEDAAELTSKVFELAADPAATEPPMEIPPGAFLPTGGVITFDPADATPEVPIVASTENGEAAVVVDNPNAFPPGTGTVTIALARAPDGDVEEPGGFIPGFQAFPEGYEILSSHQPSPTGGGVIIALCVVLPAPASLVIGHLHNGSVELLVPTDPDPEAEGYIDCTTATTFAMDMLAPPGWLQYARRLVEPVVKLLEPQPLNAVSFRGRGLGGRTTSLSTDAAVDPTIDVGETVQLSVGDPDATWTSDNAGIASVNGSGAVTGVAPSTTTITADFGDDESLSMEITVQSAVTMLAFTNDPDLLGEESIFVINRDGSSLQQLTSSGQRDLTADWSPDGNRIAFATNRDGNFEIYVMNADGSGKVNLTNTPTVDELAPDWSPDGTKISYTPNPWGIYVMDADGSNQTLISDDYSDSNARWSPDGTRFVFNSVRDGNNEIYTMNVDGSGLVRLTTQAGVDGRPAWSPDGTMIAFESERDGQFEIYVMNADGTSQTRLRPGERSWRANWTPGSKIIFDKLFDIVALSADGTGREVIPNLPPGANVSPDWRP